MSLVLDHEPVVLPPRGGQSESRSRLPKEILELKPRRHADGLAPNDQVVSSQRVLLAEPAVRPRPLLRS